MGKTQDELLDDVAAVLNNGHNDELLRSVPPEYRTDLIVQLRGITTYLSVYMNLKAGEIEFIDHTLSTLRTLRALNPPVSSTLSYTGKQKARKDAERLLVRAQGLYDIAVAKINILERELG